MCYDHSMAIKYPPETRVSYDVYLDNGSHESSPGYAFDFYRGREIARAAIKQAYIQDGVFGRYTLRNVSRGSYRRPIIESMRGYKNIDSGLWEWSEESPDAKPKQSIVKLITTSEPSSFQTEGSPFQDITVEARIDDRLVGAIVSRQYPLSHCREIGNLSKSAYLGHINRVYCIEKILSEQNNVVLMIDMVARLILSGKYSCVSSHYISENEIAVCDYPVLDVFQSRKITALAKVAEREGVFVAAALGTY